MAIEIPPFKPFDTVPFPNGESQVGERPEGGAPRDLETVLEELHDSEINAGLQTYNPAGLRVWIGDQLNGLDVSAHIGPHDGGWLSEGTVAQWLHETAIRLYPESDYAKWHR
jgi:hypothetical protein